MEATVLAEKSDYHCFDKEYLMQRSVSLTGKRITDCIKKFIIPVLLSWLLMSCSPAWCAGSPEGWELFYRNPAGDSFYYDPSAISRKGAVITVQSRALPAEQGGAIRETEQTVEINCSKRISRRLTSSFVRSDGSIHRDARATEWSSIPFDSLLDRLAVAVCGKPTARRPQQQ